MWFIGVEVEQDTSAPPPQKNPGSAPAVSILDGFKISDVDQLILALIFRFGVILV